MPDLSIKNAPDEILRRLRERASRHRRSLQGELLAILEECVCAEERLTPAELVAETRLLKLHTPSESTPTSWPGFTLRYGLPDRVTCYHITVVNEGSAQGIMAPRHSMARRSYPSREALRVPLVSDGARHELRVSLR